VDWTEVECSRGDYDFQSSNINGDGSVEVARDCDKSNIVSCLIGNTTSSPRTGVRAITNRLCTKNFKRLIERFDSSWIANDMSTASVEDRCGLSNPRISDPEGSDLIEGCLPEALSR
jgi:hypothetical protein